MFGKIKRKSAAARLVEEQLYERVIGEFAEGQRRDGLWAKSLANSDGQEDKAKALYIQYRVQSLKDESELLREEKMETNSQTQKKSNISSATVNSFTWWKLWAWLGLILGNIYTFTLAQNLPNIAIIIIIVVNSILMLLILAYNKYAFLAATILSLNPLLWIVNGIYLHNRWNHPLVNKDSFQATIAVYIHGKKESMSETQSEESTLWIHVLVWVIAGLILLAFITQ